VKSAPRAEFLLPGGAPGAAGGDDVEARSEDALLSPEVYDAEPDCAPAGSISGLTFLNFVMWASPSFHLYL
jgi:hypothetical protein